MAAPDAEMDVATASRVPGLDQEGDERADDEDRLEPLPEQDDERLDEELRPRHRLAENPLGAREAGGQLGAQRLEFRRRGAASRAAPQGGELRLELGGEGGIHRAHARLHLLEGEIRLESLAAGLGPLPGGGERQHRIEPPVHVGEHRRCLGARLLAVEAPDGGDRRGRALLGDAERLGHLRVGHPGGGAEAPQSGRHLARGCRIPKQGGVRRGRPAVRRGEPRLEGGHGRAGHADGDSAVEVEGRHTNEPHAVRQRAGRRIEYESIRAVPAAGEPVAAGAVLLVHLCATRERGRRAGDLIHIHTVAFGQAVREGARGHRERVGVGGPVDRGDHLVERTDGGAGGLRWQSLGGAACLGQEEAGLLHLGGHDDPAPRDADAVFLRRELDRRRDALDDRRQVAGGRGRLHPLLGGGEQQE